MMLFHQHQVAPSSREIAGSAILRAEPAAIESLNTMHTVYYPMLPVDHTRCYTHEVRPHGDTRINGLRPSWRPLCEFTQTVWPERYRSLGNGTLVKRLTKTSFSVQVNTAKEAI